VACYVGLVVLIEIKFRRGYAAPQQLIAVMQQMPIRAQIQSITDGPQCWLEAQFARRTA